ncbi:hypothetical protein D3C72_1069470 [compost metagenome]
MSSPSHLTGDEARFFWPHDARPIQFLNKSTFSGRKAIPSDTLTTLRKLIGLRNALVHDDLIIEPGIICGLIAQS